MINYYFFFLLLGIIITGVIFVRSLLGFLKKLNNSKIFFLLFVLFVFLYLVFKLVLFLFLGPDIEIISYSKFSGNDNYIFSVVMFSFVSFFLHMFAMFFILTGLSFRGVKMYEYIMIFIITLLFFVSVFSSQITGFSYSEISGWTYSLDSFSLLFYTLPISLFAFYFLAVIAPLYFQLKNDKVKHKLKYFIDGMIIIVIFIPLSYLVLRRFFTYIGVDIIAITVSSVFLYYSIS